MQTVPAVQPDRLAQAAIVPALDGLVDRSLWLYLFLAPPLLFPTFAPPWTALAALVILLTFILRRFVTGHFIPRTSLDWPIVGLLFMAPIGAWASVDIMLSLPRMTVLLLSAGLFYATVDAVRARPARLNVIMWGLALVGGAVALVGLFGADWFTYKLPGLGSIYDQLPRLIEGIPNSELGGIHPNELAGTLVFLLPVAITALLANPSLTIGAHTISPRLTRLLAGVIAFVMSVVLFLSQSRIGLTVFSVTMLILLAARSRRPWWMLGAGAVLVGVGVVVIKPERLIGALLNSNLESSWQSRIEVWRNALQTVQDFPATGIGLGAFARVSPLRYPYLLWPPGMNFGHAHNVFLQVGVDLGLIGLISALMAAVVLVRMVFKGVHLQAIEKRREIWVGASVGLLAYVLFGLTDAVALGAKPSPLVWVLAALSVAVIQRPSATPPDPVWPHRRIGLTLAVAALIVITIGPTALASRLTSNVGLVMLNRSLAQDGVFAAAGRDAPSLAEAERWLTAATNLDATNRGAWRGLGFGLAAQRREDEAVAAWRAAELTSQDLINFGEQARQSARYGEALDWYAQAARMDPVSGIPWYYIGLGYEGLNDWGQALDSFQYAHKKANGIDDIAGSLFLHMGLLFHIHTESPDLPTALGFYERALASDRFIANWERVTTHYHRGDVLHRQGRMQEAAQEFTWVINAEPNHYWAHMWLGEIAWQASGDLHQAEMYLKQAIALRPDLKWAYRWLGSLYQQAGRLDVAAEAYRAVLAIDPEDAAALRFFSEQGSDAD